MSQLSGLLPQQTPELSQYQSSLVTLGLEPSSLTAQVVYFHRLGTLLHRMFLYRAQDMPTLGCRQARGLEATAAGLLQDLQRNVTHRTAPASTAHPIGGDASGRLARVSLGLHVIRNDCCRAGRRACTAL